jgi:hypothetical protein
MGKQQSAKELNAMRKTSGAVSALATALTVIVLGLGAPSAQAQRQVQLISFMTTPWRYDASGTDQMTAWRARTFNDGGWTPGMGLIGVETTPNVYSPYTFNTTISPYNDQIITYYFRAHFTMVAADFLSGLTLVCSNLVDDGSVIYLNGTEVGRPGNRVPAGQNYLTVSANQGAEGVPEVINLATNALLVADNVIAVEVHQVGTGSSDIVHGLSLTAIVPSALAITSQPPSQLSTTVGSSVALTVGVSGGPVSYQWQTNNGVGTYINIPGATGATYNFLPNAPGTNVFRAVASNAVNTVISTTCTVTVGPDQFGPLMLSANVAEDPTKTNRIVIAWNENLLASTVNLQSATNFTVFLAANNSVAGISNVQYSSGTYPLPGIPPTVTLTMYPTNWFLGSNYCILVSNVRDNRNNTIAANSRICLSWPNTTNVMQMGDAWDFSPLYYIYNAFTMTNIYTLPWMATNFVVDPVYWGTGGGILYKDSLTPILTCAGDSLGTELSIQDNPTLFRRTFMLPTNATAANVQFKLRYIIDDGAVFFLNGKEMYQVNMGQRVPGTPITETTLGGTTVNNATCVTNDNFTLPANVPVYPGVNWMAVAVCQENPLPPNGADDIAFGLEMDARIYNSPPVLPNPIPTIAVSRLSPTTMRMTWTNGFGFALESSTRARGGPWTEAQPNMGTGTLIANVFRSTVIISNLPAGGSNLFYRLHKVQLQP